MTKQDNYIVESIKDMKASIEKLSTDLNKKIDNLEDKINDINIHYTEKITALEESNKGRLTVKFLITILGVLIGSMVTLLIKG